MGIKKLEKLRDYVEGLHDAICPKISNEPVQYWRGGDWQAQGLEKAYTKVLKKIQELQDEK